MSFLVELFLHVTADKQKCPQLHGTTLFLILGRQGWVGLMVSLLFIIAVQSENKGIIPLFHQIVLQFRIIACGRISKLVPSEWVLRKSNRRHTEHLSFQFYSPFAKNLQEAGYKAWGLQKLLIIGYYNLTIGQRSFSQKTAQPLGHSGCRLDGGLVWWKSVWSMWWKSSDGRLLEQGQLASEIGPGQDFLTTS